MTVNNVKHRGSPFYFAHTFFSLPDKDDFLASLELNPFSPPLLRQQFRVRGFQQFRLFRRYEARELLPHDRGKYFSSVDAWRGVPIFFVNGTKTGKIGFKLRSQKLSETIAASILVSRPSPLRLHPLATHAHLSRSTNVFLVVGETGFKFFRGSVCASGRKKL